MSACVCLRGEEPPGRWGGQVLSLSSPARGPAGAHTDEPGQRRAGCPGADRERRASAQTRMPARALVHVAPCALGRAAAPNSPCPFVAHGPRRPQGGPRRQRSGWKIPGRQEERGPAGCRLPAPPPPLSRPPPPPPPAARRAAPHSTARGPRPGAWSRAGRVRVSAGARAARPAAGAGRRDASRPGTRHLGFVRLCVQLCACACVWCT